MRERTNDETPKNPLEQGFCYSFSIVASLLSHSPSARSSPSSFGDARTKNDACFEMHKAHRQPRFW